MVHRRAGSEPQPAARRQSKPEPAVKGEGRQVTQSSACASAGSQDKYSSAVVDVTGRRGGDDKEDAAASYGRRLQSKQPPQRTQPKELDIQAALDDENGGKMGRSVEPSL